MIKNTQKSQQYMKHITNHKPKDFAIFSDELIKKNINKTPKVKRLEKKLKREQVRRLRKYECLKKSNKNRKGESTRQNIHKQIAKI